jgi:sugar/nucleoside kinase (ribokinase family)
MRKGKTFRWEGEYGWDFSDPRTISTCLNVFSHFQPRIPKEYTQSKYVFLANIDPQLQMNVLDQVKKPKLVVCDTMNYWIENKRKDLIDLLKKVDIFLLNDSEARMLTGKTNLAEVARIIRAWGPRYVIIKKGEHGAVLFMHNSVFSMPALLLDSVVDPTGAGDTFAGGLVGYLAQCNAVNQMSLRRAVVFGSIMATFAVEQFSIRRLLSITKTDVTKRFKEFKRLTNF